MSGGGRERASLAVEVWKSSQNMDTGRSGVRSIAWLGLSQDNNPGDEETKRRNDDVHTDARPKHERVLPSKIENTSMRCKNDAVTNAKGDMDQGQRPGDDKRKGADSRCVIGDGCCSEQWRYFECESSSHENAVHET